MISCFVLCYIVYVHIYIYIYIYICIYIYVYIYICICVCDTAKCNTFSDIEYIQYKMYNVYIYIYIQMRYSILYITYYISYALYIIYYIYIIFIYIGITMLRAAVKHMLLARLWNDDNFCEINDNVIKHCMCNIYGCWSKFLYPRTAILRE